MGCFARQTPSAPARSMNVQVQRASPLDSCGPGAGFTVLPVNPRRSAIVSFYPCDSHRERVNGALSGARVTVLHRDANYSRKLRLCEPCLSDLVGVLANQWQELRDGEPPPSDSRLQVCTQEGCDRQSAAPIFGFVYPRGFEPRFFYGRLCGDHATARVRDLELLPNP